MDSSQPTTPDFPLECSPHFSYDLHSDSSGTSGSNSFGIFSNDGGFPDISPRLGAFDTLAVGTLDKTPHNCFSTPDHLSQSYSSLGSSSIPHNFASAVKNSAGKHSATRQETFAISPSLTLSPAHVVPESGGLLTHQAFSDDDANSLGNNGNTSSTTCGQHQVHASGRRGSVKPPQSLSRAQAYGVNDRNRGLHQVTTDADVDDIDDRPGSVEMEAASSVNIPQHRSHESKQQRIEAEQKRRNELRDGYARLKGTLPNTNRKSSKINLLDRAVTYIHQLELNHHTLQSRLNKIESDLKSERSVNETIVRTMTDQNGIQVTTTNPQTPASAESSNSDSEPSTPAGQ